MFIGKVTKEDVESVDKIIPFGYKINDFNYKDNQIEANYSFVLPENETYDDYKDSDESLTGGIILTDFDCRRKSADCSIEEFDKIEKDTIINWQIFMLKKFGKRYYNELNKYNLAEPEVENYFTTNYQKDRIKQITEDQKQRKLDQFTSFRTDFTQNKNEVQKTIDEFISTKGAQKTNEQAFPTAKLIKVLGE